MRVHFVRHAQSVYNAQLEATGADPMAFDAPLTDFGIAQATEARSRVSHLRPTLIVSSPLSRALQTTLLMMPPDDHAQAHYEVWPEHAEWVEASCDIGANPSELQERYGHVFRGIDELSAVWWWVPESHPRQPHDSATWAAAFREERFIEPMESLDARVDSFAKRLRAAATTHEEIMVFGHGDFHDAVLRAHFGRADDAPPLRNCEVVTVEMQKN